LVNLNPINPLSQIDKTANIKSTGDQKKLMEVCREFESIFINTILKQSRSSLNAEGLTEKSYARQLMEELHDEELSKEMAEGQGVGLARELYKQLSRNTLKPALSESDGEEESAAVESVDL